MWEQRTNNTKDQWKIVGSLKRSITKQSKKMEKNRNTKIIWKWDNRGPLVWWFAWEMSPRDSGVWTLGPQLLGRFGRCSHAGESTALWGWWLWEYTAFPCFHVIPSAPGLQLKMWLSSFLLLPLLLTCVTLPPCHDGLLPLRNQKSKQTLFLKLPLTMVLPHSRKVTHKIRGYFESLNSNELESLYKTDKYIDTYNPQNWTNEFF